MDGTRDIGIALSGGGHRATAFSLGALLAVVDARLNEQTVSVSSVSGGSIANAVVMNGIDYGTIESAGFEAHIRPALRVVADRGLLLGGAPATTGYLRLLIACGAVGVLGILAAFVVALLDFSLIALIVLAVAIVALFLFWKLLRQRSAKTERAIDDEVLGGRKVTLGDVQRAGSSVHHVICTTELQSGEPFYFTNRCVYNYRFRGATTPNTVPLALAAQASACVPGAFNPRVVPLAQLGLATITGAGNKQLTSVVLDDGGVYDNMADEWEYGYDNRSQSWDGLAAVQPAKAAYLVVVNGSGGWNTPRVVPPGGFANELQGLLRAQGVQYDVSTAHRRRALFAKFVGEGSDVDGIFAQITDSPYRIPDEFAPGGKYAEIPANAAISARASAAIAFLDAQGYSREQWSQQVSRTNGVGTTLEKVGQSAAAELVEHGYVLTMVLMHVLDDRCPLRAVNRQRFADLCR